MNSKQRKAVETMKKLINGQLKAKARIWGSIEAIPARNKRAAGGILKISEHPELQSVAPTIGEYEFAGYHITRRQVDQLDNCTVTLA